MARNPEELYQNDSLIIKFKSSQSLYIGYLAGVAIREKKGTITSNGARRLILVK